MNISFILIGLFALVFLGICVGALVIVWRLVNSTEANDPLNSRPVAVGYSDTAPSGELVADSTAPIRSYLKANIALDDTASPRTHRHIFEIDIDGPMPDELQLVCMMSDTGPSHTSATGGGLQLGLDDLEDTFRIHARKPHPARDFLDAPELIDALCDLAYSADLTLLQNARLTVVFYDKPDADTRASALSDIERCWRTLQARAHPEG